MIATNLGTDEGTTTRDLLPAAVLLESLGFNDEVLAAQEDALLRRVTESPLVALTEHDLHRLPRLAFLYEEEALAAFGRALANSPFDEGRAGKEIFTLAYDCWRAVATPPLEESAVSSLAGRIVVESLPEPPLKGLSTLALHLSATGTLAEKPADVRLDLADFNLYEVPDTADWPAAVAERVVAALALLVRKGNGWRDINKALEHIAELRQLQSIFETSFLNAVDGEGNRRRAAIELVGLYHLAQIVSTLGEYLRDGQPSLESVSTRIERHRDRARELFTASGQYHLAHVTELMWATSRVLATAAIWSHTSGLSERVQAYVRELTAAVKDRPVIELWPSQQKALRENVLATYHRAVLVKMPTSAGKTLLAKFSIVQSKSLHPSGRVVYLVPTRALVNQVTVELRQEFGGLDISVEQAVPAFELDPVESALLAEAGDVLVTTPEKFDLLLRRDHPVTRQLVLVVADEAHGISDESRGARLELLLGTIKRERPDARFLLLSPFIPAGDDLVAWLGDTRALPPISVEWAPSQKLIAAARNVGRGTKRRLVLEAMPSAHNGTITAGRTLRIANSVPTRIRDVSEATIHALRVRGSVLVICRGRGTAAKRAAAIAKVSPPRKSNPLVEAVCKYIDAEAGTATALADFIRRGVAFHHAGLSSEARALVERLIRDGYVDVVCGTTTLAAGVNFPIRSVVVETLKKGSKPLSFSDFWNIAGRAGRALVDPLGVIAHPVATGAQHTRFAEFLQDEATAIVSQLTSTLAALDDLSTTFNMGVVKDFPALGSFMQFLAHAMRVAGSATVASEVEDLLRSTLVYRQALKRDPEGTTAKKLVRLVRRYVEHVRPHENVLSIADATGFATPSVLYLQRRVNDIPDARNRAAWTPAILFGANVTPLAERIRAVSEIPEIQLGSDSRRPFSPERVAGILKDWVSGDTLSSLAEKYNTVSDEEDDEEGGELAKSEQALGDFSQYLFSNLLGKASWGLGALESVCLAGQETEPGEEAYIPAMVYFGVQRPEAVWLRMVGVPRILANSLSEQWQEEVRVAPSSFEELRRWVSGRSDEHLRAAIPRNSGLTPADLRVLWGTIVGDNQ